MLNFKWMLKYHQLAIKCHMNPRDLTKNKMPRKYYTPFFTPEGHRVCTTRYGPYVTQWTWQTPARKPEHLLPPTRRQLPKQRCSKDRQLPARLTVPVRPLAQHSWGEAFISATEWQQPGFIRLLPTGNNPDFLDLADARTLFKNEVFSSKGNEASTIIISVDVFQDRWIFPVSPIKVNRRTLPLLL